MTQLKTPGGDISYGFDTLRHEQPTVQDSYDTVSLSLRTLQSRAKHTQQFSTTTSMGRLTMNVLLSFAQFEREVTSERIRDKIAAPLNELHIEYKRQDLLNPAHFRSRADAFRTGKEALKGDRR